MGWSMTVVRHGNGNNKRDSNEDANDHKILVQKGKRSAFSSSKKPERNGQFANWQTVEYEIL